MQKQRIGLLIIASMVATSSFAGSLKFDDLISQSKSQQHQNVALDNKFSPAATIPVESGQSTTPETPTEAKAKRGKWHFVRDISLSKLQKYGYKYSISMAYSQGNGPGNDCTVGEALYLHRLTGSGGLYYQCK